MLFKNANISFDKLSHAYFPPKKFIIKDGTENTGAISRGGQSQATLTPKSLCKLDTGATLLVDFGEELSGGIKLVFYKNEGKRLRLSFGESAKEALSGAESDRTGNDFTVRDTTLEVPSCGTVEYGKCAFRFVYISPLDAPIYLSGLFARVDFRDLPWLGTFEASDRRLAEIWRISARTLHLNMQELLLGDAKEKRLPSLAALYPELRCAAALFGNMDCVKETLDFIKNTTPKNAWMEGYPSRSLIWVLAQYEVYMYSGELDYLGASMDAVLDILARFAKCISGDGSVVGLDKYIDTSTDGNASAKDAAFGALAALVFERGAYLCRAIGKEEFTAAAERLEIYAKRLRRHEAWSVNRQAIAMQLLSGQKKPEDAIATLTKDTAHNISAFWGYATLAALSRCGAHKCALDAMKKYWGAMLELGATSFFEEFVLSDTEGENPPQKLDMPPVIFPKKQKTANGIDPSVNAHFENYDKAPESYSPRSLCHGISTYPLPWITEHILGVKILEPGCKKLSVEPNLLNLAYIKGTFPTPYGPVEISVTKAEGEPLVEITAPAEVEIVRKEKTDIGEE